MVALLCALNRFFELNENYKIFTLSVSVEKKAAGMTRDAGTQSTPHDLSSSSPSPASTPSIIERAIKRYGLEDADSPQSNAKIKTKEEVCCCTYFILNF